MEAGEGRYAVGGGVVIDRFDSWEDMPAGVGVGSQSWLMEGELIKSGEGFYYYCCCCYCYFYCCYYTSYED